MKDSDFDSTPQRGAEQTGPRQANPSCACNIYKLAYSWMIVFPKSFYKPVITLLPMLSKGFSVMSCRKQHNLQDLKWPISSLAILANLHRHNNRRDRGRLVPQLLGWGTNNV